MLNAFSAMSGPGLDGARRLVVRTNSIDGSNVLVEVQDSGTGIAAEKLESIFDPFITSKPEGLGMGLSICRSIIERHGGRIWAREQSRPRRDVLDHAAGHPRLNLAAFGPWQGAAAEQFVLMGYASANSEGQPMTSAADNPFSTIESAQGFVGLLREALDDAYGSIVEETALAKQTPGAERRVDALRVVDHKLTRLRHNVLESLILLNDLRILRRLLNGERHDGSDS